MPQKADLLARADELGIVGLSQRDTIATIEAAIAAHSEYDAAPPTPLTGAGVPSASLPDNQIASDSGRTVITLDFLGDGSGLFQVNRDGRVMHRFGIMQEGPVF